MSFLLLHEAFPILKVDLVVKNPPDNAGDLRDVSETKKNPKAALCLIIHI